MDFPLSKSKNLFLEYSYRISVLLLSTLILYLAARLLLVFVPARDIFYVSFIVAFFSGEAFMLVHTLGFMMNIAKVDRKVFSYNFKEIKNDEWPQVALLLPVRNEPKELVEKTTISLKLLDYENKKIYLIEDSTQEDFVADSKELAEKYRINFFRPQRIDGGKAGVINEALQIIQDKYVAIFDADQHPFPSFLKETVAIAEYDSNIAFVQTPQLYSNIHASPIAKGAAMQQSIFFENICEAKSISNSMFCCGTNVLLRKDSLMSVGGFDEASITEDFDVSVKLHMKGHASIYYNHARAFGMAPETLSAYLTQQRRWASGTTRTLVNVIKYFFSKPRSMKMGQWWEYFLSGSYYFIGWSFLFLMACPLLFLLFDVPAYFTNPIIFVTIFIPYYLSVALIFFATMKRRNYRFSQMYKGVLLSSLIFPVLIIATIRGLTGRQMEFKVTPKSKSPNMSFLSLWPWTLMIFLNVLAVMVGFWRLSENPSGIIINILWCAYHIFLLSHIYYFNQSPNYLRNI